MKSASHVTRYIGCTVAVILAASAAGYILMPGKPPDFPSGDVKEVAIQLRDTLGGQKATDVRSTDAAKVKALLAALRSAEATEEHKCGSSGKITLHYDDGGMVELYILAGHNRRFYEFRFYNGGNGGIFRTNRAPFLEAMAGFGITDLDPGSPE